MRLRFLALATGLLPVIAIHASLLLAFQAGTISPCIPYLDGCASISATGRYEPASFVFKPAMTLQAALLTAYWYAATGWLRAIGYQLDNRNPVGRLIMALGAAASIALVIYVTFLGTQTPQYEFMRRVGIYFYFLFMVIAQIVLAIKTIRLARLPGLAKIHRIACWQLGLALIPLFLGVLNLTLKATLEKPDAAENVIEWIAALLMQIYFMLSWFSWQATHFEHRWRAGTA